MLQGILGMVKFVYDVQNAAVAWLLASAIGIGVRRIPLQGGGRRFIVAPPSLLTQCMRQTLRPSLLGDQGRRPPPSPHAARKGCMHQRFVSEACFNYQKQTLRFVSDSCMDRFLGYSGWQTENPRMNNAITAQVTCESYAFVLCRSTGASHGRALYCCECITGVPANSDQDLKNKPCALGKLYLLYISGSRVHATCIFLLRSINYFNQPTN